MATTTMVILVVKNSEEGYKISLILSKKRMSFLFWAMAVGPKELDLILENKVQALLL